MRLCECCGVADLTGRHVRAKYCLDCRNEGQIGIGRIKALRTVNEAVRRGDLARPDTFKCVDCGEQAACWEHRDYSRPLDVEPVCRACNHKRGPAANNLHIPPAFMAPAIRPADSGVEQTQFQEAA